MPEAQPQSEQRAGQAPPLSHVLLVLLAGAVLYIPGLGRRGFAATEGHRVIPGWEMLETGNFFLPQLFGQVYLRKPPGMPWAVALSSTVFGQTEFAARFVSASSTIALALITTLFAARWFGRRYALAGGLAALLTPLFWSPARTAEIEALNNFAAAASVFLILDLLLAAPAQPPAPGGLGRDKPSAHARPLPIFVYSVLLALSLAIAGLAKGPAAAPAIAAAVLVPCLITRSAQPLRAPALWLGGVAAATTLLFISRRIAHQVDLSGQTPVLQGVSDFLWTGRPFTVGSVLKVIAMPAAALLSITPWSLAMLFPWGRDARAEASVENAVRAHALARAVTLTALLSILLLAVLGVRNERYAQPCLAFVPVLAAYALRGFREQFLPHRQRIAGALMLGSPFAWPALLAFVAIAVIHFPRERPNYSGLQAGLALGEHLAGPAEMWADHAIEARPEVLLYAQREAARRGQAIRPRWVPGITSRPLPGPGAYLLLRNDEDSHERSSFTAPPIAAQLEKIAEAAAHKFRFTLLRVRPLRTASPDPAGNSP